MSKEKTMNDRTSLQLDVAQAQTDWVKVMVSIDRPPAETLAHYNRREKLEILEQNAKQHRSELVQWLDEHGLAPEVARIGASTSLNVLFVQCTPHVARELQHAPGVTQVMLTEDNNLKPMSR